MENPELHVKKVSDSEDLATAMGLSPERKDELDKKLKHLIIDHSDIVVLMQEISKECKHINELAMSCFILGNVFHGRKEN